MSLRASVGHGVLWLLFIAALFSGSTRIIRASLFVLVSLKTPFSPTAIDCRVFLVKPPDWKITSVNGRAAPRLSTSLWHPSAAPGLLCGGGGDDDAHVADS